MLMAGLDGIENKIDPGEPLDKDIYGMSPEELKDIPSVAGTLNEALDALEADHDWLLKGDVFTKDVIDMWLSTSVRMKLTPFACVRRRRSSHSTSTAKLGKRGAVRAMSNCITKKKGPSHGGPFFTIEPLTGAVLTVITRPCLRLLLGYSVSVFKKTTLYSRQFNFKIIPLILEVKISKIRYAPPKYFWSAHQFDHHL